LAGVIHKALLQVNSGYFCNQKSFWVKYQLKTTTITDRVVFITILE